MDVENKIIHELIANSEFQKSHIVNLEKALKQEAAKLAEIEKLKNDGVQKLNEVLTVSTISLQITRTQLIQKMLNC